VSPGAALLCFCLAQVGAELPDAGLPGPSASEGASAAGEISGEDLARRAPRTTPDALRDEAGVFLQRASLAGGAPIVRGLYGQQVLVLVDGVPLNSAATGPAPDPALATVDPFTVEEIQVFRGAAPVQYGSAVGGVVNVLTEVPRFSEGGPPQTASARLLGDSADWSLQAHFRGAVSLADSAAVASASARAFQDLYGGPRAGVQRYTGYDEYDAQLKVRQRLGPGAELRFQYQAARQVEAPSANGSTLGDFRISEANERDLFHGSLEFSRVGPFRVELDASAQRLADLVDHDRVDADLLERDAASVWTFGARAVATANPALGFLGRSAAVLGADAYYDLPESRFERGTITDSGAFAAAPERMRYPAGAAQLSAGAFTSLSSDPSLDFGLHAGARAQLRRSHLPADLRLFALLGAPAAPASDESALGVSGELGVSYRLFSGLTAVLNGSSGFTPPSLDDYLRLGAQGIGYRLPTRNLRPQRSYSGEVGLAWSSQLLRAQAFYAYTRVDGLIGIAPVQIGLRATTPEGLPYLVAENADRADVHAVDGAAAVRLPSSLTLSASFGYVFSWQVRRDPARGDFITEPLPLTPPAHGAVRLTYEPRDGLFIETAVRWALAQYRFSETDRLACPESPGCGGAPGYAVVDLRGGYRLNEHLAFTLAGQNLSNATYRLHGSALSEPGLSAALGVEGSM